MLIQFVLVAIQTLASTDQIIELGEVLVHPNVYVLILNLANVHLPRARMNETGGGGAMNFLRRIITVDRFVIVLNATSKQCPFRIVLPLPTVHPGSTSFRFDPILSSTGVVDAFVARIVRSGNSQHEL